MSIETPQPKRDPEFYDEEGRVKDPEIAHTMANKANQLFDEKKEALKEESSLRPFEKMNVELEFKEREAALNKWMDTGAKKIKESDEYDKKQKEADALLEGPSLLSVEEEQALLERFGKLKNIKVDKRVFEHLFDGKKHGDIKETDFSIENFTSFLESLDRFLLSNPAQDTNGAINLGFSAVRCANGKTSMHCWIGADHDRKILVEAL